MTIHPIKTDRIPIVRQNLFRLLDRYVAALDERTVLAITSKLVSICQGRFITCAAAEKQALIESEADSFLPPDSNRHHVVLTIKEHRLIPSAGIDESNADGHYILWPLDAQSTANAVRSYLRERFSRRRIGVIITDSTTAPLRCGVTGVALAHSGFLALNDYIGARDVFGRPLRMTKVNVSDALATAAVLAMGEGNEQTPLALITGLPCVTFQNRDPSQAELDAFRIQPEEDLYAPLLQAVNWRRGGKAKRLKERGAEADCASSANVSSRAR